MCGNYGYYEDDTPLPKNYRTVYRYLKGSFVIFAKTSIYNEIIGTYDARHSKMTAEEFRKYILNLRQWELLLPREQFMIMANKDPFAPIENPIEDEERRKQIEKCKRCEAFVIENIKRWSFAGCIDDVVKSQDEKIGYYYF